MAEVVVLRAAGDDQRVVAERLLTGHGPQRDGARAKIERGHLGEFDPHALLAAEDRAERVADLAGGQRAGRHLVGQRLEEMEVAAVDERDLDVVRS